MRKTPLELRLHERLFAQRRVRVLAQHVLADLVAMHICQNRRNESGQSQTTLNVIRKPAVSLSVKLQFEAVSGLNPEEKNVIRSLNESIVLRNTFRASERRFSATDSGGAAR